MAAGWEPEVRLAAEIVFPTWLLLRCFAAFAEERPETRIQLFETVLGGTDEALLERRVDFAISTMVPPGFAGESLMRLRGARHVADGCAIGIRKARTASGIHHGLAIADAELDASGDKARIHASPIEHAHFRQATDDTGSISVIGQARPRVDLFLQTHAAETFAICAGIAPDIGVVELEDAGAAAPIVDTLVST